MKKIQLSNGGFAMVDDEDYDGLSKYLWYSYCGYAYRTVSRLLGKKNISMHVDLLGKKDGLEIDHIDGNRLNNQKSNLRFCTRSQNQINKKLQKNNTSGYKGVSKRSDSYVAQIKNKGKVKYIGSFGSAEDAARAYDKEAKKTYGEFAYLNFSEKG